MPVSTDNKINQAIVFMGEKNIIIIMGMAQMIEPVRHRNLKGSYGVLKQEHYGQNTRAS